MGKGNPCPICLGECREATIYEGSYMDKSKFTEKGEWIENEKVAKNTEKHYA
ncbi:hypothetical protein SAMN06295960_3599 [Paenibacillus aquistagni]|uniref:Uncharacterized protein n=1 Tax=Paenibacillus aquistagni TaxID=1852522 RepID=A0A1X7LKW9_9BACL|nr:hypothetical protein SAMN06295960_3599 [Paenibacillus aquistagni]